MGATRAVWVNHVGPMDQLGIAAGDADADIVVQDVDAAPAGVRIFHHGLELGVAGDVGLEGRRGAAFFADHVDGFPGRIEMVIHAQHAGALRHRIGQKFLDLGQPGVVDQRTLRHAIVQTVADLETCHSGGQLLRKGIMHALLYQKTVEQGWIT